MIAIPLPPSLGVLSRAHAPPFADPRDAEVGELECADALGKRGSMMLARPDIAVPKSPLNRARSVVVVHAADVPAADIEQHSARVGASDPYLVRDHFWPLYVGQIITLQLGLHGLLAAAY